MRCVTETCLNGGNLTTPTRAPTSLVRFQGYCITAKWGFFLNAESNIRRVYREVESMKRLTGIFLVALFCGGVRAAELPEITDAAIAELGITLGTPQMNGFVFIDGRYISPPYTVTRKGNGIFINRI